jgi:PAS domain S-box-containing protein
MIERNRRIANNRCRIATAGGAVGNGHRGSPRKSGLRSIMPVLRFLSSRPTLVATGYAVMIAALVWGTLAVAAAMSDTVMIWPVNAITVAVLARQPTARWLRWLAITWIAIAAGDMMAGVPAAMTASLATVDLIEILIVAGFLRRMGIDPRQLRDYFTIVAIAALGAGISATLFGGIKFLAGQPFSLNAVARCYYASAMGLVILLPPLKATRSDVPQGSTTVPLGLLAMPVVVGVVALAVFAADRPSLLFLLMPCGVFAAFRYRFVGAAVSTLTIATVATVCTVRGIGPISAAFPVLTDRVLFLQLFLSAITLTAFPVATLLYQRQRTLAAIRTVARELRLLTDHSNDLIVRMDMHGVHRYASPASERLLGYSPAELMRQGCLPSIHPDDLPTVEGVSRQLVENGGGVVACYRQRHRDGHYVWLEGAFRLIRDGDRPVEIVATIRDIGERRAAEQAAILATKQLDERQRLLSMAEAAAQIGHWRLSLAERRVFWSPEVFRIHGRSPDSEPPYTEAVHCYHPDDQAMVTRQIEKAFATGGPFGFEARLVRPDGAIRWVSSRGQAERGPDGTITGLFGVFQDTTDQVLAMTELRAAREQAEGALAERATFTATISHEIRTPLTSILAAVQLLRDTPQKAERMRHLDSLEQAGRMLSAIVDDVLTFTKLEGGHGTPESIAFEPAELVRSVTGMFAADAAAHAITLGVDAGAGRVLGDPARLRRVLTNLIGNAIKFTRAGSVRVSATPSGGGMWCFDVADTGVGIRDDRLEVIFEPFVQADASTTRSYGGTGLGLSISRMLVESMGGMIGVDSLAGEGSRFWFTLPLLPAEEGLELNTPSLPAPVRRPRTVLVAEDNDTNRYLIAELLRRLGHRVVAVENGARAVEHVTDRVGGALDIILMDVQMPVMDGIAAARAIRAWNGAGAGVPIHALTADLSDARRRDILAAGMNGVMAKPVDLDALKILIDGLGDDRIAADPNEPEPALSDAIDPGRIRALDDALGVAARNRLLGLLIDDTRRIPARMRALVTGRRMDLALREAHGLRGAAASVGATGLIAALRSIETAGDGVIDPAHLNELDRQAGAVVEAARSVIGTG